MNNTFRNILTIVLICLFIVGQYFLIIRILSTVEENLQLKYAGLAREAVNNSYSNSEYQGMDNVIASFDTLAEKYIIALSTIPQDLEEWVFNEARKEFNAELINKEELSILIQEYFRDHNLKDKFRQRMKIKSLILLSENDNYYEIFSASEKDTLDIDGMKVNTFFYESDLYRLKIETEIKLKDKLKIILRESSTILLVSLLCISLIFVFYFITLSNLIKEKKLSNMKTDFMNNLMHELKTPLATISIAGKNLEIEKVQKQKEKILEIASTIERQNVYLNKLVNHIVDISMWEKEQFHIERVECNLNEFLKEVIKAFKSGNSKNLTIIEKFAPNLPDANIDIFHFTTLINNLLSNAVKYNSEPVEITVATQYNNAFKVSIADNGNGISPSEQKHIFNKFYRSSFGNIYKSKGLGLGLYFAKKIIEAHDGEIKLTSKIGVGSKFTVTF